MVQVKSRAFILHRTPRNGTSVTIKGAIQEVYETMLAFDSATKKPGSQYLIKMNENLKPVTYHWVGWFDLQSKLWRTRQAAIGEGYMDGSGYLWVAVEDGWQNVGKIKGDKGDKGDKGEAGPKGPEGPQIVLRTSEWSAGVEYHNDEGSNTWPRFLDQIIVTQPVGSPVPFEVYICKHTHVASSPAELKNTDLWQPMNNMAPIYTPLIIAQNAYLMFSQTNQLLVTDNNKVIAGMGGGAYPLWVGGDTPSKSSFYVTKEGRIIAKAADIEGIIKSKMFYSSTKVVTSSVEQTFYMNPAADRCNCYLVIEPDNNRFLHLPRAADYDGLELQIFVPRSDHNWDIGCFVLAQPSDSMFVKNNAASIMADGKRISVEKNVPYTDYKGTSIKIANNQLTKFKSMNGAWYALEGLFTGE